jgi:hypothetical protein
MDFLIGIWDQVVNSNLLEPSMWVWAGFILFFIVIPVVSIIIAFKIAVWILEFVRDWWHEKS